MYNCNVEDPAIHEEGFADGGEKLDEWFELGEFLEMVFTQNDFLEICKRIKNEVPM